MNTRAAIRLAIPCVCFAAAWSLTHVLRPTLVIPEKAATGKITPAPKRPASLPSAAAQKIAAALESTNSGNWQAVWEEFAAGSTEAELIAVATGPPGMAKNLAWEELAARRPELLSALAEKNGAEPELVAAAAAVVAARDPEKALEQILRTRLSSVHHAVLATVAWSVPDAARRMADKLPREFKNGPGDSPSRASISMAWTRRDPLAAASAGYGDIAMWMRTDAIGALQYLLSQSADGRTQEPALWMVGAALRQSPAEAVKLLESHPALLEVCGEAANISYGASMLIRWYAISPESCLAGVEAGAAKHPSMRPSLLHIIASSHPDAAAAVAARFSDFDLNAFQQRRTTAEALPDIDPVAAADALLAALEQYQPADAMATAGLTASQALRLGTLLANQLPDKARALAATTTPEAFTADPSAYPYIVRSVFEDVWPGTTPTDSPEAQNNLSHRGAGAMLQGDPARYAATVDPQANEGWAAWNTATNWAPHDMAAASAWVRALPAGVAKQRAEAALAMELAVQKPEAGLTAMAALPDAAWADFPHEQGAGAWLQALHHIVLTGGDWQRWQAKTPAPLRQRVQVLASDALDTDAALLDVLRRAK